ncbi:hypothetical protein D915_001838 [Fasciola hepatica]|uniref:Uncharacterized protein n=1 Tax=Fasciola hepatica TaxID=6192 RepID=A0A4E0RP57_FASHE|nr:hypothetical protein D915_001838 [Fasciola hepatica]
MFCATVLLLVLATMTASEKTGDTYPEPRDVFTTNEEIGYITPLVKRYIRFGKRGTPQSNDQRQYREDIQIPGQPLGFIRFG